MNNLKHTLLICNSNMFVPLVLSEVLANPDKHYIVASDTKSISQFFEFLNIPNVIYVEYENASPYHFYRKRLSYFSEILKYDLECVIFFHAEFGGIVNYLIHYLSHNIPVYYCKLYNSMPMPHVRGLKAIKCWLASWLISHESMDILNGSHIFPSLPESFFQKVNAQLLFISIKQDLINEMMQACFDNYNFNKSCVLLTGTVVINNLIIENDYTTGIKKVIDVIGLDNMVSKQHPRYNYLYGQENKLQQLPSFIPGNLLIGYYNIFIGYESTLLVEAAKAGKKSISLIYLMPPVKDEIQTNIKALLCDRLANEGVIYFPKSLIELENIIYQ